MLNSNLYSLEGLWQLEISAQDRNHLVYSFKQIPFLVAFFRNVYYFNPLF